MVTYVKLSKLTWTMEEGLIGRWYKEEGDRVEKGETLCEVETEKTVDVIEAPESGVIRKITALSGSIVPVNQILAVIAEPDEALPDLDQLIESAQRDIVQPEPAVAAEVEEPRKRMREERIIASPAARKLAEEHEIDLRSITGTGPGGRIVRKDVLGAAEAKAQTAALRTVEPAKVIPLAGMRKVIADRLAYSARTALQVPLTIEVDMTEAVKFLQELRIETAKNIRVSYTDILVKAAAKALKEHPNVNSMIENEEIKILQDINIGVAVALEDGLIVPVVRNADRKTITEISATIKELVEKSRQGKLLTKEASGGTFTISNLGMFGIDLFAPIINPPESAILGVGRVAEKPVVRGDQITVRSMMTLTLVFDHRIMDGAVAARFLQTLKNTLENPREHLL